MTSPDEAHRGYISRFLPYTAGAAALACICLIVWSILPDTDEKGTATVEGMVRSLEKAINTKDGTLYYSLLSPGLQEEACLRHEALKGQFEDVLPDCASYALWFYGKEMKKRFPGEYSLSINQRIGSDQIYLGILAEGEPSPKAFTAVLARNGHPNSNYMLGSDLVIDEAIQKI